MTFKAISSEKLSLKRLVEFREREEKDGTGELQALRHNYLEAIERYVVDISKVAAGSSDRLELDRIFQSEMVRDFSDLKQELGFATKDAWFSTSMLTMESCIQGRLLKRRFHFLSDLACGSVSTPLINRNT